LRNIVVVFQRNGHDLYRECVYAADSANRPLSHLTGRAAPGKAHG
jgi:hypothetical protein